MNHPRSLKFGMVSGPLLGAGLLVAACTNDFRSHGLDGSGGGGADGSADGSTGGYACDATLVGAGGGIYLDNCDEWLGERAGVPLNFACGQGGEGGGGGAVGGGGEGGDGGAVAEKPALQRVCEAPSNPDFNRAHPVYHCLDALSHSVCSVNHELDVRACLTQGAPCEEDLEVIGCTDILESCSALTASACFWAMTSARNPNVIAPCFANGRGDESCEDTFMRCAWGL